jgi:adenosine kinase
MDRPGLRALIDGAAYLLTNEYEAALTEQRTGWSADDILGRVGVRVTTLGRNGALVERRGESTVHVAAAAEVRKADPTGVGDAFRAGFLAGLAWGVGDRISAQVGSLLATYVIETVGTQEYVLDRTAFLERLGAAYGDDAAAAVEPHLRCPRP